MNILDEIIEVKKVEVKNLKKRYSLNSFEEFEFFKQENLPFSKKIKDNKSLSIIAEIKKASPSKGIIREDFNHLNIAEIYLEENVNAISILTDEKYFQGNINYLNEIARIKTVPLLRKDFIIDAFQIFESKANGADLILLISEVLSKNQINELTFAAKEIGLEILLEIHSKDQLAKIDFKLNDLIGINNRNLKTFEVNLNTLKDVGNIIPENISVVAESGINSKEDVDFIKTTKADSILVGEFLMKEKNIKSRLKELKEWCVNES